MILGMSTATFTLVHVLISLAGIVSGFVVLYGLIKGKRFDRWTGVFLTTTALTSITGFGFPFDHLLPSHKIGILSLLVLAAAIPARYAFRMQGTWRLVYVIGSAFALYFNTFVLVVQSFMKIPALKALAPTQQEPPFLVAQLVVLLAFIWLTTLAVKGFHIGTERAAASGASS
jgi:hypothetical protein